MAQHDRHTANHRRPRHSSVRGRKATVVHDGTAFELASELRGFGYDVDEGPVLSFASRHEPGVELAIISARAPSARPERLQAWTRELCSRGTALVAVGAAIAPVAEFFGGELRRSERLPATGRLADVVAVGEGLFAGVDEEFRLALPAVRRIDCEELNAEFGVTAWSRDGELVGASHVFRPIHLLHPGALESPSLRSAILANLSRLIRDRGGRAF